MKDKKDGTVVNWPAPRKLREGHEHEDLLLHTIRNPTTLEELEQAKKELIVYKYYKLRENCIVFGFIMCAIIIGILVYLEKTS